MKSPDSARSALSERADIQGDFENYRRFLTFLGVNGNSRFSVTFSRNVKSPPAASLFISQESLLGDVLTPASGRLESQKTRKTRKTEEKRQI